MTSYSNTATSSITMNGLALTSGSSPAPAKAPQGLIVTRAVETKEGWVGQIIVDEAIIYETSPYDSAERAEKLATKRVIDRIKKLLS